MHASVVICTYNRADSLRDTLSALRVQEIPSGVDWEVVVVDNNSSDQTEEAVREFMNQWPRLRYVFEAKQGLSHARNRGIAESLGDTILFTDDDVLPAPDWVVSTLSGLDRFGADACGGYIAPIWESEPPDWLTERFHGFLAIRTDRTDCFQMSASSILPFGANMAFRRSTFARVGSFDTNRGRKGSNLASGEDGELFERVLGAGLKVVFLGDSRVRHKVEAFRLTKRYLRRWRFQASRNIAESQGVPGVHRVMNVPPYLVLQACRALARAASGYVFLPKDEAFSRELIVCHFAGLIHGLYRIRA